MFQRKQAVCPYGTLHKATIVLGPEQHERIQTNSEPARATSTVKVKNNKK